jgi:hypothetical protein
MITYSEGLDFHRLVDEAKNYVQMHLNKNNKDEAEVPVQCIETKKIKYLQFVNTVGNWVYVGVRK